MKREFVLTSIFERRWQAMGLGDDDLRRLEERLLLNPKLGKVVPGTGSLRKMRFTLEGRGKSGGARILYVDFAVYERVYLFDAYPKSEKANLTKQERNNIKAALHRLENELKRGGH